MCTLVPAKAHEVQLGVDQSLQVQSNVLRRSVNGTPDATYKIAPIITFAQPRSDFTYDLMYRPSYTAYFRTPGLGGFDHLLRGVGRYQLDGQNALVFDTNFIHARAIRSNEFSDALGQPLVVANDIGTTQRFVANIGFEHSLSPRTLGSVGLDYNRWDYTTPSNVNNQGFGARVELTHALHPRVVLGANVDARYRAFEETSFAPSAYTTVVNSNLLAIVDLTETLKFQASGGPAGVVTRQSVPGPRLGSRFGGLEGGTTACPVGPCGRLWGVSAATSSFCATSFGNAILSTCLPSSTFAPPPDVVNEQALIPLDPNQVVFGRESEDLTYFVSLLLTQRFVRGSFLVAFVRNEDAGGGVGATTILNTVSARFAYSLTDVWKLAMNGVYTQRESVSTLPRTSVSARQSATTVNDSRFGVVNLAEAQYVVASTALSNFQQTVAAFDAILTRRMGEHSSLRFTFRYDNQSQDTAIFTPSVGFDNYTGGVSFVYEFDPYKF